MPYPDDMNWPLYDATIGSVGKEEDQTLITNEDPDVFCTIGVCESCGGANLLNCLGVCSSCYEFANAYRERLSQQHATYGERYIEALNQTIKGIL